MSHFTIDQQDEIDNVMGMLHTVQQLMIPHKDLSMVNRDELACLFSHFSGHWGFKDEDQQDEFKSHLSTVLDLTGAEQNLSGVDRGGLAWMLGYLLTRLDSVIRGES